MKTLRVSLLMFMFTFTLVGGCAAVAPYERERLARRDMELQRSPDVRAGEQHANSYREGATGAEGSSGGGCGCN